MNLNLIKGTITFWTRLDTISFSSTTPHVFFEHRFVAGGLCMKKTSTQKLIFTHTYNNKKSIVKTNIANLNPSRPHFFAATWSMGRRIIRIYVDGILRKEAKMD